MMTPLTRPRIMVIGFDANFCYLMKRYGRISAHRVIFANHNEDLLAQAQTHRPGVIFVEVAHPATFAWETLKTLKASPETRSIPVVICSWQEDELCDGQVSADYVMRLPMLYENFLAALAQTSSLAGGKVERKNDP